ncbi:unnamed protein product [Protopolystoma xenopodis]|uniref:Uncharacterized protein n=1 Tax=Protopolystoma xenopodis TaxID=117903 RepID=A0A448WT87_9PLAT|nr:unnamed protein product [Protopolystoma xenopodis]
MFTIPSANAHLLDEPPSGQCTSTSIGPSLQSSSSVPTQPPSVISEPLPSCGMPNPCETFPLTSPDPSMNINHLHSSQGDFFSPDSTSCIRSVQITHRNGEVPEITSELTTIPIGGSSFGPGWPGSFGGPPINEPTTFVVKPNRTNPLKPPTDSEVLYILPSISMRLTTDQRQSLRRPPATTILQKDKNSVSSPPKRRKPNQMLSDVDSVDPSDERNMSTYTMGCDQNRDQESNLVQEKPTYTLKREVRSSIHPHSCSNLQEVINQGFHLDRIEKTEDYGEHEIPIVHLSFQTDFHGVIQLGLIDVPWLPSLIDSYLKERPFQYDSKFKLSCRVFNLS